MTTTTIKSILSAIKTQANALHTLESKSFESKADAERGIGGLFAQLVTAEGAEAKPNSVYDKYAKSLPIGKTIMVNECYEFAMLTDAKWRSVVKAYKAKGIKGELNADGSAKLHTEKLGRAVKAYRDGRYTLTTGELKAKPNGGGGKSRKAKAESKREKVVEFVASQGDEIVGSDWDLRYIPTDELKAMQTAIKLELEARALGAKVIA